MGLEVGKVAPFRETVTGKKRKGGLSGILVGIFSWSGADYMGVFTS